MQPSDNPTENQNAAILAHLQKGGTVTSLTALQDFQCLRLSARIFDLRKAYEIKDRWLSTPSGKAVKEYYMERSVA